MAGSRVHKLRSIFERTTGLIEGNVIKDKPIWYDVYKEHPPKYVPTFARPTQDIKVKQILYEEDRIRAQIHKKEKIMFNLAIDEKGSKTKTLIDKCKKLMEEKRITVTEAVAIITENESQKIKEAESERNL